MGHLLIDTSCFNELCKIKKGDKDNIILNFIAAIRSANNNSDLIYREALLSEFTYPFGYFFIDFTYSEWKNFNANKCFQGITQTTHQILNNIFYSNPNGGIVFDEVKSFLIKFNKQLHGFIGLLYKTKLTPYVSCFETWNNWHINYIIANRSNISWNYVTNNCLPNLSYSNLFLAQQLEIDISLFDEKRIAETAKKYCNSFPIPKLNRGQLMALAVKLGKEVARRNYYEENSSLSKNESKFRSGSKRLIFESQKNGNSIFMSIDFEKCNCYELCDHNGKHLGEFRFDGILISGNDKAGEHDIWAITKK